MYIFPIDAASAKPPVLTAPPVHLDRLAADVLRKVSFRDERRTNGHYLSTLLTVCDNVFQDVVRLLAIDQTDQDYIDSSLLRLQTVVTNGTRVSHRFPDCL